MVKNYTKLFVAALSFLALKSNAQVTAYSENFGGAGVTTFPGAWTSATADWLIDPNDLNGGGVPACTIPGSSGNSVMAGADGTSGVAQSSVSQPFSTVGYSSLTITWNGYRGAGAPAVTLAISTDDVSYTTIPFTDVPSDDTWHSVSAIAIPPAFEGQATVYLKWSYVTTATNFFAFDDLNVQGTTSPIFYWNGSGAINTLSSWGTNTNGTGLAPGSFTANQQIFNLVNNTSATLGSSWTIGGTGSILNVGDGVTGMNLTTNAGLTFTGGAQMIVLNTSTLTMQSATFPASSDVVINTGSTINFAQSSVVSIWPATYHNLTISGGADKNSAGSPVVNGILNLNGRNLAMTNSALLTLTFNGTITGSGSLKTGNSRLTIGGSGTFGTINFTAGFTTLTVNQFNVNRTSGDVTLGSDLTVTGASSLQNGSINLNGKVLTLNGAITFPATASNGNFIGSATSSLTIGGTGAFTNNTLFMNQGSAASRSLFNFLINRSNGQTLNIGNALDIINSITTTSLTVASGGNITLKADASRSAMVGQMSTGGSISGNVNVETIAATSGTTGWTNLSPTVNGMTVSSWDGQFPMSCSGCINDENSAGGYFVSIQGWNEAASGGAEYVELTGSSPLTLGKGYWVYLGTGSGSTSAININTSGTIGQGVFTVPVTVSAQSGDNLVSNPFPAPISWPAVASDPSNSNLNGSAIVYSPAGGQITVNGSGSSTPGGFINGGVIPRGQGFYVHATSGGNVTFRESHKSTANTSANPILRTATPNNEFRLSIAGPYAGYDEALFIFDNNASENFDRLLDAYKMFSTPGYVGYPGVYSQYTSISSRMADNHYYAINAIPAHGSTDLVFPILAKAMVSGTYTIAPIDIQNTPVGSCVILKDKLLNINHDLRNGAYVCTLSDTAQTPRFELTVCRTSLATGIQNASAVNDQIFINQDQGGAYVKTNFAENTKATISAYNTMGQQLMTDKQVEGKENTTYLDLGNVHSQVVIIKVTTATHSSVKKLYMN
eukprot:TRINITY_DN17325_c0_g1_i1.p1 TRINITY_DN17325_c0_g1~~TRINITY_DN17325_c0_g1_i1.p1  ORF type:complete len:1008 (+),score=87.12 TRINITY_DN17325_c0_g1_i1:87-3110(+)